MDGNFRGYVFEIFALFGSFSLLPVSLRGLILCTVLELLYLKTPILDVRRSEGRSKVLDSS